MDEWIDDAVLKMHKHRITQKRLAERVGVTKDWISILLLGKSKPTEEMKGKIKAALDEMIAEKGN